MKLYLSLALFAATAEAFAPSAFGMRPNTLVLADSASLIEEALATSKKFGASSPEARLAWETVEEVASSDNRYVRYARTYFSLFGWPRRSCKSRYN
jgi:hypothetical protein